MREVNFSIPSANKASVGITAALYDRRALDCTSTLPLINSLNHLSYLTTSSARIREILTIDGGVERLVHILKQGRSKDMMDTWKWNLAFHCVFNIGVRGSDPRGSSDSRGSETIRTRVVEADIVPVLATILDNYMKALDKVRSMQSDIGCSSSSSRSRSKKTPTAKYDLRSGPSAAPGLERRRHAPPPLDALPSDRASSFNESDPVTAAPENTRAQESRTPSSGLPFDRMNTAFSSSHRHHHHHHQRQNGQTSRAIHQDLESTDPRHQQPALEPFTRPRNPLLSRDAFATQHAHSIHRDDAHAAQPETPTTPAFPARATGASHRRSASAPFPTQMTVQQDLSMSGDSSDGDTTGPVPDMRDIEPALQFRTDINADTLERTVLLDGVDPAGLPAPDVTGDMDADTFNITHRSTDGSIIDPAAAPPNTAMEISPIAAPFADNDVSQLVQQPQFFQALGAADRVVASAATFHPSFPRDEDVIMALQLLAYVSKYPSLRPYFQQTHLVPKLKIDRELHAPDGDDSALMELDDDNEHEYCQPNDYNIFPLVEKFTVRHHASDVVYWAGVVMRNLCRKDKSRGDIRQCAYYKCGKWEEYAREFAKCRRCRQTKYCSKECQKSAWVYHRHWCEPANEAQKAPHNCQAVDNA